MIIGAHAIVMSTNPEADRAFFRDVLKLDYVDEGGGWLIFGLPPSEVAFHPGDKDSVHELYLMCKDVYSFISAMNERGIESAPVQDQGWGVLTSITLPGGGKLGVYEPRHKRPNTPATLKPVKTASKPTAKKSAKPAPKPAATKSTKKAAKPAPKKSAKKPAKPAAKKSVKKAPKKAASRKRK
jgi:hypothetical protein